jgi:aryl-alcohol dehydrogenase-like predicted oxidoreductase
MQKIRLGRTDLLVSRSGFGAIPIQRIRFDEAKHLLRKAYDHGINFFDTARGYTNSEEKIGYALSDVRKDIILATKSPAKDKAGLLQDIETSLSKLNTDYIDILQVHNPSYVPTPDGEDKVYEGLLEAKAQGKIRFIGFTNHRIKIALEAIASDLYDTLQFPLSCLSAEKDLQLIAECQRRDLGVIAMKALSGGLITNAAVAFTFLRQYDNVAPIWGIEQEAQLDEFLALEQSPPALDGEMWKVIEQDRKELSGAFCRGCGYCLPCPVEIPINMASRMMLLLHRMPYQRFITPEWKANMELITECTECGQCRERCPYDLDPPALLKQQLPAYREFYAKHAAE